MYFWGIQNKRMKHYHTCLSVAGSDPYGGAGIQADLKTFAALGCYGAAAITALTVQNSRGVKRSVPVDAALVYDQAAAVMEDIHPQALKIGMTVNTEIIHALCHLIDDFHPPFVVLDPVMVSSSGRQLLDETAIAILSAELLPRCTLVTPNLPELEILGGEGEAKESARRLITSTGCPNVLVKGGHRNGSPTDLLVDEKNVQTYEGERITTRNTHGTGCTMSSAIAAHVARGYTLEESVGQAKIYVTNALRSGAEVAVGNGNGAMNHFFSPLPLFIGDF